MEVFNVTDIESGEKYAIQFHGDTEPGFDQRKTIISKTDSPNMMCYLKNAFAERGILIVSRDVVYHQRTGKYLSDCMVISDRMIGVNTILAKMRGEWYDIGVIY